MRGIEIIVYGTDFFLWLLLFGCIVKGNINSYSKTINCQKYVWHKQGDCCLVACYHNCIIITMLHCCLSLSVTFLFAFATS